MESLLRNLPPMPWHLETRGVTLISLHIVDADRARAWVPPEYPILRFWPGKTIGGLWVAEYGPGSDLQYNELIVGGATVWYRRRPAIWVTHLFVDNPESVEGGRALLGAPKHLTRFARQEGQITIGEPDRPVCCLSYGRQLWLWRQRVRIAALHLDVRDRTFSTVSVHGSELRGQWGVTRANATIPGTSPLRDLGFGRPVLGVCGRDLEAVLGGASFLPLALCPINPGMAE